MKKVMVVLVVLLSLGSVFAFAQGRVGAIFPTQLWTLTKNNPVYYIGNPSGKSVLAIITVNPKGEGAIVTGSDCGNLPANSTTVCKIGVQGAKITSMTASGLSPASGSLSMDVDAKKKQ